MTETPLQKLFLTNFRDGDEWVDSNALTFTDHGAFEVAKFFYLAGLEAAKGCVPEEKEKPEYEPGVDALAHRALTAGFNGCRTSTLEGIEKLNENV